MLALRLSPRHPVVRLARRYEHALGRHADAHLCVSRALQRDLAARRTAERSVVLYDRPAARFVPLPDPERAGRRARFVRELALPEGIRALAFAVAPSSWTADEDMGLLLDAVVRYDEAAAADAALPDLLVVLTGEGALRAEFERRAAAALLARVHLRTRWLEAAEYPTVLAAADLGLSLHRSTSGLDLPMKVADLLGAGVPVCALDYGPCLAEAVRPGENGVLFTTADELAARLCELLRNHPDEGGPLARLRRHVLADRGMGWDEAWTAAARPLFTDGSSC
jgi:beta-1,4-mannosyltransferase